MSGRQPYVRRSGDALFYVDETGRETMLGHSDGQQTPWHRISLAARLLGMDLEWVMAGPTTWEQVKPRMREAMGDRTIAYGPRPQLVRVPDGAPIPLSEPEEDPRPQPHWLAYHGFVRGPVERCGLRYPGASPSPAAGPPAPSRPRPAGEP